MLFGYNKCIFFSYFLALGLRIYGIAERLN